MDNDDPTIKALQEEAYLLIDEEQDWFTHHYNMSSLAKALVNSGHLPDMDALLYYIEKPYKWTAEWEHYVEHGNTENYGDE